MGNDRKVGKTIFDIKSDKTVISVDGNKITLSGEERNEFIGYLKEISQGEVIQTEDAVYDVEIDFCNGNSGKISTVSRVFLFDAVDYTEKYAINDDLVEFIQRIQK